MTKLWHNYVFIHITNVSILLIHHIKGEYFVDNHNTITDSCIPFFHYKRSQFIAFMLCLWNMDGILEDQCIGSFSECDYRTSFVLLHKRGISERQTERSAPPSFWSIPSEVNTVDAERSSNTYLMTVMQWFRACDRLEDNSLFLCEGHWLTKIFRIINWA